MLRLIQRKNVDRGAVIAAMHFDAVADNQFLMRDVHLHCTIAIHD